MTTIAVLGGGISGLSVAYYLSKARPVLLHKVLLLESASRIGGWVKTVKQPDGSLFEHGPRSIRGVGRAGLNTLHLIDDLGLSDSILPIPHTHIASRNRFVFAGGQLCVLPNSISSVLFPTPPFHKPLALYGALEPFQPRSKVDDESVDSFFCRRFGEEIAKFLANPLCRGVFAGDSCKLSMRSCFPIFYEMERDFGSIIIGSLLRKQDKTVSNSQLVQKFCSQKWSMWSFISGLQQLPDAIGDHLLTCSDGNVDILTEMPCTGLDFTGNKAKIFLPKGQLSVDHVICAVPSYVAADLLEKQHPVLASLLHSIKFASVAVVNIQYHQNALAIQGFGHLIPSFEIPGILGVLYESCVFPQHNGSDSSTRLTVMMGGAWFEECFGDVNCCDSEHIAHIAVKTVANHLQIHQKPICVIPNILKKCIPQYRVGHHKTLEDIASYVSQHDLPLTLTGASYNGVSLNDCIYNAKMDVDKLLNKWKLASYGV